MAIDYRPSTEEDLPELASLLSIAFASDPDQIATWLRRAGLDRLRTLTIDDRPQGSAMLVEMGQYFGAARVPMTGVAAVTVSPEARGKGVAADLMRRCLDEIRASNVPLSVLYASAPPVYRRVGYEQAGHHCAVRIDLNRIESPARGAPFRRFVEADMPGVRDCYARIARHRDGYLDRARYLWDRITSPRGKDALGFVLDGPDGIDAYVFLRHDEDGALNGRYNLAITDMTAATPDAARSLLAFLEGFSSMGVEARWRAGPADPLLMLIPEQYYTVTRIEYWMLRLADVRAALAARAYPPGITAQVSLDVRDDLYPDSAGPITLSIENGAATVEPGAASPSPIRLDARALAAIYTGFHAPIDLARLGLVEGDDDALRTLGALFAGQAPSMPDMF